MIDRFLARQNLQIPLTSPAETERRQATSFARRSPIRSACRPTSRKWRQVIARVVGGWKTSIRQFAIRSSPALKIVVPVRLQTLRQSVQTIRSFLRDNDHAWSIRARSKWITRSILSGHPEWRKSNFGARATAAALGAVTERIRITAAPFA